VGLAVSPLVTAHFDDFVAAGDDVPDQGFAVSPKAKLATTWGQLKHSNRK